MKVFISFDMEGVAGIVGFGFALRYDIPCVTTLPGAMAAAEAIAALGSGRLDVASLQQLHQALAVRS